MKQAGKRSWLGLTSIFATLLAFLVAMGPVAETWRGTINANLGISGSRVVQDLSSENDLYTYKSIWANTNELVAHHKDIGERMSAEGSVLLKNDGNALPMAGANVTLFGMGAYYPFYGGSMGSSAPEGQNVSLAEALTQKGISVNPKMQAVYEAMGSIEDEAGGGFSGPTYLYRPGKLSNSFGVSNEVSGYEIREPSPSIYTEVGGYNANDNGFSQYSDAAIVVFSRPSSEAADYYPGALGIKEGTSAGATDPLGLDDAEREVLALAKQASDKIVVLINSNSTMEIEELKQDSEVDAILWIGTPGNYGMLGVADILSGAVSPSGHLPDTYAVVNANSPAAQNFGMIPYANQDEISDSKGTYADLRAGWYYVTAESIYTGYRYYETRYADTVLGNGNASSAVGASNGSAWAYQNEVSYPFGYGLSYTTFEQTLKSVDVDLGNRTVTAVVNVKNTGSVAGKDVVQLYVSLPYTQYDIDNGVEKAAIQLLDFGKTSELAPGADEDVKISVDMKYMASYDSKGAKTYILDAGDYYFTVGNGAHAAVNNVLTALGRTGLVDELGGSTSGNSANVKTWNLAALDTTTFAFSYDGDVPYAITNQMDDTDLNYWNANKTVTYLSRNDWAGTFPTKIDGLIANSEMLVRLRNDVYEIRHSDVEGTVTFGVDHGAESLKLADLKDVSDFDDERWDYLLDQLTLQDAMDLLSRYDTETEIPSIERPLFPQADGPNGFNGWAIGGTNSNLANRTDSSAPCYMSESDPNAGYSLNTIANEPVMAATFNKELVDEWGQVVGNDSLWVRGAIVWGNGLNTHRLPYNSRNHEYFSEDAMLCNRMGVAYAEGAKKFGLIMAPKHFALNTQETNRVGISEFINEQTAREGDLRAFQGAFEDADVLGAMTAFNRIGCTYMNGHVGVMQNILRGEWGFKGLISTDMVNGDLYFQVRESAIGGVTMMANSSDKMQPDGAWYYFTVDNIKNDAVLTGHLRENAKYLFYAVANSNAMNGFDSSTRMERVTTWWEGLMIGAEVVFGLLTVASLAMYVLSYRKKGEKVG